MLSKLHSLNLKLCSKQYNKNFVLHLIVSPQLGNITTQPKQGWQAMPMSSLCILLCLWVPLISYVIMLREVHLYLFPLWHTPLSFVTIFAIKQFPIICFWNRIHEQVFRLHQRILRFVFAKKVLKLHIMLISLFPIELRLIDTCTEKQLS